MEHLTAPRTARDVTPAEAAGEQGSMVGGMGVRVTLAFASGGNGEARIREAGVRVFGSCAPLAPGSALVARVAGRAPADAAALDTIDLLGDLGATTTTPLPPAVAKGARFVVQALRCALGLPLCRPADPNGRGVLVCRCLGVGDRQIREMVEAGAHDVEAIADLCGATRGCGSCRPDLEWLLHEVRVATPAAPSPKDDPLARILDALVVPRLAAHGVALHDAAVTGTRVTLRLAPPTTRTTLSPRGAASVARQILRDVVWAGIEVVTDPPR